MYNFFSRYLQINLASKRSEILIESTHTSQRSCWIKIIEGLTEKLVATNCHLSDHALILIVLLVFL